MAAVWGVTHFLRVSALAHAHDLPVSPIGNSPVGLLHAATSVPNHLTSEFQGLTPPPGVSIDLRVEDGAFVLGDSPGLGVRVDEDRIRATNRRPEAQASEGPDVRPELAGRRLLAGIDGIAPHGDSPARRCTSTTTCRPPPVTDPTAVPDNREDSYVPARSYCPDAPITAAAALLVGWTGTIEGYSR